MAGLVNDALGQSYTIVSALSEAGYLVKPTSAVNTMDVCTSSPVGYTMVDSKDAVTGVAQANKKCAVVGIVPGQKAELRLLATNAEIAIGDMIGIAAGGTVDKATTGWILGFAQEARALNAGAAEATYHIKVIFAPHYIHA